MPTLDICVTKGADKDKIVARRADGGSESFTFPKKGPIPHDCVHLFVEGQLGLRTGFWGRIAQGARSAEIQETAKAGGHASASRAVEPDPAIVELIQAERLVECFEADFWGASQTDFDTFRGVVDAACAASFTPPIALSEDQFKSIRARIAAFAGAWMAAPVGAEFPFRFSVAPG